MGIKTKSHPDWALKHKSKGTELRHIHGRYYLYEVSSVYDKKKKRAQKITGSIIGKITEKDGLVLSEKKLPKNNLASPIPNQVYNREYGLSQWLLSSSESIVLALKKVFPDHWALVLGLVYCRLGWQSPLKNAPFLLQGSALQELLPLRHFNEKSLRATLSFLGNNTDLLKSYMRQFIKTEQYNLIDATEFFSKSKHISLSQKGYNKDWIFDNQISLLYIYSTTDSMPVFYKLLAGNLREVKTMSLALKESAIQNAVIIADKGFYSKANILTLKQQALKFIIPLKRDNICIDYTLLSEVETSEAYFKYKNRYIYYTTTQIDGDTCVLFYDGKLKEQEKTDYLNRIETLPEKFSHQKFVQKYPHFGTIALLHNLKDKPEDIYTTYKSRAHIEQMFDTLKNTMEADHSYMQSTDMLEGWMFINHVALQYCHTLYNKLKIKGLLNKYSIEDIVLYLKHFQQVSINGAWYNTETTAKTAKVLAKIGLHIT